MENRKSRKSNRLSRNSLTKAFQTLRRSSSIVKDIPKNIISQQIKKIYVENVWCEDNDGNWILYKVIQQDNSNLILYDIKKKKEISINLAFHDVYPSNNNIVSDMIFLRSLNEPTILSNLNERYMNKFTYTYMGSILIAVNPFEWSTNPNIELFSGKIRDPENPHPYAIAESAYQQICLNNPVNQSIVISGESGAGKTETAKMILSYLVECTTKKIDNDQNENISNLETIETVEKKLLLSSPILESFGNAQTSRNFNSSRFGKYVKIHFAPFEGKSKKIIGASIETYLLEKSRITGQSKGERNFHIFYQLLSAIEAQEATVSNIRLSSIRPIDYNILGINKNLSNKAQTGTQKSINRNDSSINFESDLELFQKVVFALIELGLNNEVIQSIWKSLGSILELGNISFIDVEASTGLTSQISEDTIENAILAAELLNISKDELFSALLTREMKTSRDTFIIPLKSKESFNGRNALLKTIYANLFNNILTTINQSLVIHDTSINNINFISVLDIFGFESFETNDFEQLLINYANEALQCTFNEQVFQNDLQLFHEEQIEINLTLEECPSNIHCVRLISSNDKSPSIFSVLQSVAQLSTGNDENFCESLHTTFSRSNDPNIKKYFLTVHPKDRNRQFSIKHYAGRVTYTVSSKEVNNWINKNYDFIPDSFLNLLHKSTLPLIQTTNLTDLQQQQQSSLTSVPSKRNVLAEKKITVSDRFIASMNELVVNLKSSSCSFIKCIKPNKVLKPLIFDNLYVVEQVRSLGLVQVCEVMKVGLPIRLTFCEIFDKFKIFYQETQTLFEGNEDIVFITVLLYALEIPIESYRLGKKTLFFTGNSYEIVDEMLSTDYTQGDLKQKILDGMNEGLKIWKNSQNSVQNFKTRLELLEDQIHSIKLDIDNFDQRVLDTTNQLEFVNDQIRLTRSTISMISDIPQILHQTIEKSQKNLTNLLEINNNNVNDNNDNLTNYNDQLDLLKNNLHNILEKVNLNNTLWTITNEKLELMDESQLSQQWEKIKELSSKTFNILKEIDEIMPHIKYLIDKTINRAARSPISKVESWIQGSEHNISLISSQLNRTIELTNSGQIMTSTLLESILQMKNLNSEILLNSQSIQSTGNEIEKSCSEFNQLIEDLKNKIIEDENKLKQKELEAQEELLRKTEREAEEASLQQIKESQLISPSKDSENLKTLKVRRKESLDLLTDSQIQSFDEFGTHTEIEENEEFNFDDEDDDGINNSNNNNEDIEDLPLGWERIIDSETGDWIYKSLLTNEYQKEFPLYPARTKEFDESSIDSLDDQESEQEKEKIVTELESKNEPTDNDSNTVSKQRKRISFISIGSIEITSPEINDDDISTNNDNYNYNDYNTTITTTTTTDNNNNNDDNNDNNNKNNNKNNIILESTSFESSSEFITETSPKITRNEQERTVWIEKNTKKSQPSLLKKLFSIVREEYTAGNRSETVLGVFKKGIVYKQGKFFGSWKKIYVVLDGDTLEQYKSSQAYHSGSPSSKHMQLTGRSVLSYTKYSHCFTVHTDSISWILMTETDTEFTEWMNGLNTVIATLFHERIEKIRLNKYR